MKIKDIRTNREIVAERIVVIDSDGSNLGEMSLIDGIKLANDKMLDLVEIVPKATPSVCKIIDFGKYRYQLQKKQHLVKKNQKKTELKEIRVRPNIAIGDYNTKLKKVREFIEAGNKVKISILFKGREQNFENLGHDLLNRFCKDTEEIASLDGKVVKEGRNLYTILCKRGS